MTLSLKHDMNPRLTAEDQARQNFVMGLRSFVLNDMAAEMRLAYDKRVAPDFARKFDRAPKDGTEVHRAMRDDTAFKLYSALRVNAQKMVWESVIPVVEREGARIAETAAAAEGGGSVELDPDFIPPRNITALDVHLMPGSYTGKAGPRDLTTGAVYDQGLAVFSFGLMGDNLDDIGRSMAHYVHHRYPDFRPARILDLGCTIGHNTLPWAKQFPEAEVHAIDAAAPGLLYGHARAKLQGAQNVHFKQMDASRLPYEDGSFDLVFSSMFLHELSLKTTDAVMKEAYRVLRPGGLMLHMELPPNPQMSAYESFYLDWDCYYNAEPFYKAYRDQDPQALCVKAGFRAEDYIQFVAPSLGGYGIEAANREIDAAAGVVDSETTGRLADGVKWFGYGAWKR